MKSKFNYCNSVVTQAIYVLRKWLIVSTSSSSKKRETQLPEAREPDNCKEICVWRSFFVQKDAKDHKIRKLR